MPDTVKSFGEIDGEDADIRVRGQHGTDGMQEGNDSSSGGSGGSKSTKLQIPSNYSKLQKISILVLKQAKVTNFAYCQQRDRYTTEPTRCVVRL